MLPGSLWLAPGLLTGCMIATSIHYNCPRPAMAAKASIKSQARHQISAKIQSTSIGITGPSLISSQGLTRFLLPTAFAYSQMQMGAVC